MSRYKSKYTGLEIDANLDRARNVSNPNLLDNWYFGNPVNQRGQNEYTNSDSYSYGIDRWICKGIALSDTGITFTGSGSFMDQILEPAKKVALSGKAVTASVLLDSGELIYGTLQYESSASEQKFFATENIQLVLLSNGIIRLYSIGNYTAVAAKLELGDQQTLAHKDENGNWVLNEIPDYGEQLRRCQRYALALSKQAGHSVYGSGMINAGQNARIVVPLPVTMRTAPTVTKLGDLEILANGTTYVVTSVSVESLSPTAVCIVANSTSLSTKQAATPALLRSSGGGKGELFLSADL